MKDSLFIKINVCWLFMMTLDSFYLYQIGMPIFSVLSCLIALLQLMIRRGEKKNYNSKAIVFLFFIFCFSLFTTVFNIDFFLVKRTFLFFLLVPTVLYSYYVLSEKKRQMIKVIECVLIIHLLFLYLQFVIFYGTGYYIDYLSPITGEEQRAFGGSYSIGSTGINIVRVTGLFNEPGTYSTFIMLLFVIYKGLLYDCDESKEITRLDVLVLLSVLLTFSVYGFVFVASFFVFYFFCVSKKQKGRLLLFLLPVAYIAYITYFKKRFALGSSVSGVGFREDAIKVLIENQIYDPIHLLFGYSFFVDVSEVFDLQLPYNDVGFWYTFLMYLGLMGVVVFLFMIAPFIRRRKMQVFILFFSKLTFSTIFIWFVLSYIFSPIRQNSSQK